MSNLSPQRIKQLNQLAKDFCAKFYAVKIPFHLRFMYWSYYILLAHKGVMVQSADRDPQYRDGKLKRGYDKYHNKIKNHLNKHYPRMESPIEIPTFQAGELSDEEVQILMGLYIPFVVKGGAAQLKMMHWDLDFFADNFGDCELPINTAPDKPDSDAAKANRATNYYDYKIGTVGELIKSVKQGGNMRAAAVSDVMHQQDNRLIKDLDIDMFERMTGWVKNQHHRLKRKLLVGKVVSTQLFLQPKYAYTIWHCEPADNFFLLQSGQKKWTISHPYHSPAFNPRVKTNTTYHGCSIDVREDNSAQDNRGNEAYTRIPKLQVTVEAGDLLRLPNYWWHTVETFAEHHAIAVTLRATCLPNLASVGYLAMRVLDKDYHEMIKRFKNGGRVTDRDVSLKLFSYLDKTKNQF
jgi:hypothetical protein